MSKNECKTCKNYVQAWIDVSGEHGDCTLYPTWLDVPAAHYCGQWAASTVQEEQTPLDIDWNQVPEGYDWVAQDEDGYVYGHPDKPTPHENIVDGFWRWQVPESKQCYVTHRTLLTNWRNTLTKRPGTN